MLDIKLSTDRLDCLYMLALERTGSMNLNQKELLNDGRDVLLIEVGPKKMA